MSLCASACASCARPHGTPRVQSDSFNTRPSPPLRVLATRTSPRDEDLRCHARVFVSTARILANTWGSAVSERNTWQMCDAGFTSGDTQRLPARLSERGQSGARRVRRVQTLEGAEAARTPRAGRAQHGVGPYIYTHMQCRPAQPGHLVRGRKEQGEHAAGQWWYFQVWGSFGEQKMSCAGIR